ncbi:acyl-CoA dehydrogenase family protein [Saccharomonospora sp. NPDC006951]
MTDLLEKTATANDFRRLVADGELDLPLPGGGRTWARWQALAALGARDLAMARLAEGHTDALAILAESGRNPVPGALYGVWAAKSGGTGAVLGDGVLSGTVRFCSGAHLLDRALVAAGDLLVDVDLHGGGIERDERSWQAIGMAASDSADVTFHRVPIGTEDVIGGEGWYVSRPGFAHGGCGVAAVWLGGCRGVAGDVSAYLSDREPDEHQLAHLGAIHTAMAASEALLKRTADMIDSGTSQDAVPATRLCRAAVEDCAMRVLAQAPKATGPAPLCRDRAFAQRQADLLVYVRQQHGERELAAIGRGLLSEGAAR